MSQQQNRLGPATATESQMAPNSVGSHPAKPALSNRVKYPKRQTLRQCLYRNFHPKCLFLTGIIYLFVGIVFYCRLDSWRQTILVSINVIDSTRMTPINTCRDTTGSWSSSRTSSLVTLPFICLAILYFLYLLECWNCSTRFLLLKGNPVHHVYSYMEQMRQAKPIVWWSAASYHYVRYNQSVTCHVDSTTTTTTTTARTCKRRIDTRCSRRCFLFHDNQVTDISEQLLGLELFPITRIKFFKGFVFADAESAQEFDRQRSRFFRSNFKLDQFIEIREGFDLDGIERHPDESIPNGIISFGRRGHWYCNTLAFWLFSLILLSWPLRILLEYNTAYVNYRIVKLFGNVRPDPVDSGTTTMVTATTTTATANRGQSSPSPSSIFIPNALSRNISIDSLSNYTIAPSYSEAILIDKLFYCDDNNNNGVDPDTKRINSTIIPVQPELNPPGESSTTMNNHHHHHVLPSYDEIFSSPTDRLKKYFNDLFSGTTVDTVHLKRSHTEQNSFLQEKISISSAVDDKPWRSLNNIYDL